MACPNCDWGITNLGGATSNEFSLLDVGEMGGLVGLGTVVPGAACFLQTNWTHYAVSFRPENGAWNWWVDGKWRGSAINPVAWTNGWQPDGAVVLRFIEWLPWQSKLDMDRLAVWQRELSDIEIHNDHLAWYVRRIGVTVDPPFTLSMTAADLPVAIPDTVTAITSGDAVIRKEVTATTMHDKQIDVHVTRGFPSWGLAAGPTNVATLAANGRLTHVSDGTATVTLSATNNGGGYTTTQSLSVALATGSATTYSWTGGVPGSVRAACIDWITPRLAAGGNATRFSTIDHGATNYVLDTSCWATGLDLSCIPVWNSANLTPEFAPTLISPESGLAVNHAYLANGTTVRWATEGGGIVERTILSQQSVWGDLRAFRISAPITNILPAALMTTAITNLFASQTNGNANGGTGFRVPAVTSDQQLRASVRDVESLNGYAVFRQPEDTNRLAYYWPAIGGDSGAPEFLVISNTPVLLSVYHWGGAGAGENVGLLYNAITNVTRQLGDTNTITGFDFSGYSTY
jgi:hypothetical protein